MSRFFLFKKLGNIEYMENLVEKNLLTGRADQVKLLSSSSFLTDIIGWQLLATHLLKAAL